VNKHSQNVWDLFSGPSNSWNSLWKVEIGELGLPLRTRRGNLRLQLLEADTVP
jgi:hypothetical protein